jgi:signal transduction histidine kinase
MPRNLLGLKVSRALSEVAAGITRALHSREAQRRLMQAMQPMGFETLAIAMYDVDDGLLRILSIAPGLDGVTERYEELPYDEALRLPFLDVMRTGKPVSLPWPAAAAVTMYPDLMHAGQKILDRAWMTLPLTWAGVVHGAVGIGSPEPRDFDEAESIVAGIFVTEVARVMERCVGVPGLAQWSWNTASGDVEWSDSKRRFHGATLDGPAPSVDAFLQLIHADDRADFTGVVAAASDTMEPYDVEARVRNADGSWRWLRCRAYAVQGDDGTVCWYGTDEDITERKEAERERRDLQAKLQQAQKLESLGTLAGGIAHDFNNLLVGVLGNVTLAQQEISAASPAHQMLDDIERGAQRAAELTRQLLAYAGKGRFVVKTVDMADIVLEMRALLGSAISKRARLHIEAPQGVAWVEADATQLRQVVMNLITNASDALENADGLITVRTGVRSADRAYLESTHVDVLLPEGDYVFVEVTDTGRGIEQSTLSRIFDPFFSTKTSGHGLGLAATLGIVRGHRGTVKVYSEPGKGSAFRVLLPVAEAPGRRSPPRGIATFEDWRPGGTVLVVDDESAVRLVARRALERAGFTVVEAVNGAEAVAHFGTLSACAAVLLDLTMPELSGDEVLRMIRQQVPTQAVVLMSGYNEQDVTNRVVGRGHARFLQKPFTVMELLGAVRGAIEA